jgi:secreted trypsin-like serine protease
LEIILFIIKLPSHKKYVGKGACKGDSGGGFIIRHDNKEYIIGVVSFGKVIKRNATNESSIFDRCLDDIPSIFTNITGHKKWIEQTIKEKTMNPNPPLPVEEVNKFINMVKIFSTSVKRFGLVAFKFLN